MSAKESETPHKMGHQRILGVRVARQAKTWETEAQFNMNTAEVRRKEVADKKAPTAVP